LFIYLFVYLFIYYIILYYLKYLASRNRPFSFTLSTNSKDGVITGLVEGLKGMEVGGKRSVFIPSFLGYGKEGIPPKIPPNTPLHFEVELLRVD
jgi:FKBP-type peptidyl-prolyl cis-trans isomerase